MRQAVRQILVLTLIMLVLNALCRLMPFGRFELEISRKDLRYTKADLSNLRFGAEEEGIVEFGAPDVQQDRVRLSIRPLHRGKTFLEVYDENGRLVDMHLLSVGPLGTVYDNNNGAFSGDKVALVINTLFWFTVGAIMIWNFLQAKGSGFYAYTTIYFAGFSIFSLVTGVVMGFVTAAHLNDPVTYNMLSAYGTLSSASTLFMKLTLPAVAAFSVMLAVSNVALIRHEGARLSNALGLLLSLVMLGGDLVGFYISSLDLMGSEREVRLITALQNIYTAIYVYMECMLAGSVICAVKASRLSVPADSDFIIILGCRFRKDGSLPPLLRGRADKALEYWRRQEEGKRARFIPSGGQGADESMSEAEAISRYLAQCGVEEKYIVPEKKSVNTYENMLNSKKLIDELSPGATAVFATTNYHVFRSGVWANRAGLRSKGIGSKTSWWYWPNAFVRECLGLLRYRWKEEALLLVLFVAFFATLSMIL